jgi:hypothetical protein
MERLPDAFVWCLERAGDGVTWCGDHVVRAVAAVVPVLMAALRPVRALLTRVARLGRALDAWMVPVLRGVSRAFVAVMKFLFRWIGRPLLYLLVVVGSVVVFVAALVVSLLAPVARLVAVVARALWAAVRWIAGLVAVVAQAVGAAVAWIGRQVAAAAAAVLLAVAHVCATITRFVVQRVVAPVARAIAAGWRTFARAIRAGLRDRFLVPAGRMLGSGLRVLGARGGRLASRVAAAVGAALAPVRELLFTIVSRSGAAVRRAAYAVSYRVGVALLKARHRAHVDDATVDTIEPVIWSSYTPPFDAVVAQNEFLPPNGTDVHAILTVTAHVATDRVEGADIGRESAVVLLLDCSGSMGQPWRKLREARRAAAAAIDALRDGTRFAIVSGADQAELVYPHGPRLVRATEATRSAAKEALRSLTPEGGTAMSQWLLVGKELLDRHPHAIRRAILLTDGRNESETGAALQGALRTCTGAFQCDCRGVGTEWDVVELREIASALDGSLDIVPDPADLATDFATMAEAAMAKRVGARLRVWGPPGSTVRFVRQVSPELRDLTDHRTDVDWMTGEYAIGAWGDESRDYHLCMRLPAQPVGSDVLAARISLVIDDQIVAKAVVKAVWTSDQDLSTRIDDAVAHFTGQTELAQAVRDGIAARRAGEDQRAIAAFGLATRLAAASGNTETLALLARVVEIVDADQGVVRLRSRVTLADEMRLDTRSERTVSTRV